MPRRNGPAFSYYESQGLVRFVDAYSKTIGAATEVPHAEYVESAMNLNGITLAINNAEAALIREHPNHRIAIDSVSTFVTYTNPQTVFRFLQILIGRTRLAGATGAFLLDAGMHTDADVTMFKHLAAGVIEMKSENERIFLRADGLGPYENPGWIQCRVAAGELDLVGSFAAGRIR